MSEDELAQPVGRSEVIRVVPVVLGAKRKGLGQTIMGAVLVVAGIMLTPYDPILGSATVQTGAAMVIGGVIQMLSPQHKTSAGDKDKSPQSYSFNGPVNMDAEGGCVPLLYGRLLVGSLVISGGIRTADIAL